ncbi:MAG TPA: amidohydrolase [Mycobacteriales bacterium]|nr:amidohydrolase [Mycobacteriales bacterium]
MSPDVTPVLRPALELYLDLHRHPELSGAEARTAARFADRLHRVGFRVLTGIGGHGVVGVLRAGPGPVVLIRAELDGLPVRERTGLPYASTDVVPDPRTGEPVPVMHACGHDAPLACAAGAADLLARDRDWRGTLLVVGQPAEETLTGARAMLSDGLYDRVGVPDVVLAQHTAPLPAGMVAHGTGAVLAGSSALALEIRGRGGHAALPQLTVNPIEVAARVVLGLPGLDPDVSATAGALHAGARGNVVPDVATLELSLRGFSAAALERAEQAVCRLATGSEPPGLTVLARSPVTTVDPDAAEPVRSAHEAAFGPARVATWPGSLATEDVGWFAAAGASLHGGTGIRLAHWMLGSAGRTQWTGAAPNHSSGYAPDPKGTLTTGIAALVLAARAQLAR